MPMPLTKVQEFGDVVPTQEIKQVSNTFRSTRRILAPVNILVP